MSTTKKLVGELVNVELMLVNAGHFTTVVLEHKNLFDSVPCCSSKIYVRVLLYLPALFLPQDTQRLLLLMCLIDFQSHHNCVRCLLKRIEKDHTCGYFLLFSIFFNCLYVKHLELLNVAAPVLDQLQSGKSWYDQRRPPPGVEPIDYEQFFIWQLNYMIDLDGIQCRYTRYT